MYHLYKIDKVYKNMKKQKICVIGDGLAGLMTALVLSKSDIQIEGVTTSHYWPIDIAYFKMDAAGVGPLV